MTLKDVIKRIKEYESFNSVSDEELELFINNAQDELYQIYSQKRSYSILNMKWVDGKPIIGWFFLGIYSWN